MSKRKFMASKGKGTSSNPSLSSNMLDLCFRSSKDSDRFRNLFASTSVKETRSIDFDFLTKFKFSYLTQFEDIKWMEFLKYKRLTFQTLVRVFYSNAFVTSTKQSDGNIIRTIKSYILGKPFSLTAFDFTIAFTNSLSKESNVTVFVFSIFVNFPTTKIESYNEPTKQL